MKIQNNTNPIVFFFLLFLIFISSCDDNTCENIAFDVLEVRLEPRTLQLTGGWGIWRNENNLGIDRLFLRLEMPKNPISYGVDTNRCPNIWYNSNPALNIRVISDKDFNTFYPAGSDLTEILDFSFFLQDFTKQEFIDKHYNMSNWSSFQMNFNDIPDKEDLHTFVLIVDLEDGTTFESHPIEVLLIPSE